MPILNPNTSSSSYSNNRYQIDLGAIRSNIRHIRDRLPPGNRIMAIVKAMAYGTDCLRMSTFLASCGVDILNVSHVDEGIFLRQAGISQAIFLLHSAPYEAEQVVHYGLEVGVSNAQEIRALAQASTIQHKVTKVHLNVDTGMCRFGCRPEEALTLARLVLENPSLVLEGIMTHFSSPDDPASDHFTTQQTCAFDKVVQEIHATGIHIPWRHAANSSAVIRFHFPQYNMVRVGLSIYGLHASNAGSDVMSLTPALSLTSRIIGINICKPGETVSYGRTYKAVGDCNRRIAILPIGYYDGLHRHYSGKNNVLIRGQHCPMVGRICMDFMMVDITQVPDAQVGDSALIFGTDERGQYLAPEELARNGGSIAHELITCLGPRIERVFIND